MGAVQKENRQLEGTTGYTGSALIAPELVVDPSVADSLEIVNSSVTPSLEPEITSDPEQGKLALTIPVSGGRISGLEIPYPLQTAYVHNYLLDDVVPNYNLGVIKLLAYMDSQDPGWKLEGSYAQIAKDIGVDKNTLERALPVAIKDQLIICKRSPSKDILNCKSVPGIWILNPELFPVSGGRRTPLPASLVTHVIHGATDLNLVKVVCCIARHTIGYSDPDGRRRLVWSAGLNLLREKSGCGSKSRLAWARDEAVKRNIISCTKGPGGRNVYGLVWISAWDGDRRQTGTSVTPDTDPKRVPHSEDDRPHSGTTDEPTPERYQDQPQSGTTTDPDPVLLDDVNRPQNGTTGNSHEEGKICEQQTETLVAQLLSAGIDTEKTAASLISSFGEEVCRRQLQYLPYRKTPDNVGGFLRKSIEGDWPTPKGYVDPAIAEEERRAAAAAKKLSSLRVTKRSEYEIFVGEELGRIQTTLPHLWEEFIESDSKFMEESTRVLNPALLPIRLKQLEESRPHRARSYFKIPEFEDWLSEVSLP